MLMNFSGQLDHDPVQRSLSVTTIKKKVSFLGFFALNHSSFSRSLCAPNSLILHIKLDIYILKGLCTTILHIILPAQKHLLSLVQLCTYMIQGHYCTWKVRYSNFLAMKMVAFRASCHRNICLS